MDIIDIQNKRLIAGEGIIAGMERNRYGFQAVPALIIAPEAGFEPAQTKLAREAPLRRPSKVYHFPHSGAPKPLRISILLMQISLMYAPKFA